MECPSCAMLRSSTALSPVGASAQQFTTCNDVSHPDLRLCAIDGRQMTSHSRARERDVFLAARDLLLNRREDYAGARLAFQWPQLHTFNWATDYFDHIAAGNSRLALWI